MSADSPPPVRKDGTLHLKSSEERLWALVAARARAGADVASIDRRIWDLFGETWAVMFTDLSGFSRQVEAFGILHFLQIIHEHKEVLEPVIFAHDGVLIKTEADSLLILFRRPAAAIRCAVAMQHALGELNKTRSPETQVLLCVGIGYGELLRIGDHDVYGQEVNAASKLGEDTARATEILITQRALDAALPMEGITADAIAERVPGSEKNYRLTY